MKTKNNLYKLLSTQDKELSTTVLNNLSLFEHELIQNELKKIYDNSETEILKNNDVLLFLAACLSLDDDELVSQALLNLYYITYVI